MRTDRAGRSKKRDTNRGEGVSCSHREHYVPTRQLSEKYWFATGLLLHIGGEALEELGVLSLGHSP